MVKDGKTWKVRLAKAAPKEARALARGLVGRHAVHGVAMGTDDMGHAPNVGPNLSKLKGPSPSRAGGWFGGTRFLADAGG